MECPLCHSDSRIFFEDHTSYRICKNCQGIFVENTDLPSSEEEHLRYEEHNNDVEDIGYQNFVMPVVDFITKNFSKQSLGLDYGAGPGPVVSKLLMEAGYKTPKKYDPFYYPDQSVLKIKYDYIICCEVIEHFHDPKEEFNRLYELLETSGSLVCMTHLYEDSIPFDNWYYKNDPTHVFIYKKETIEYIAKTFGFKNHSIQDRLIHFRK